MEVVVRWAAPDAPHRLVDWLTPTERQRMQAQRRPDDQAGFLSAHVLVRIVAAGLLGVDPGSLVLEQRCPTCDGPHGPPGIAGPGAPRVSFAHTKGLVVAAAAPEPLGVDAERVGAAAAEVADVALSPTEQLQLAALSLSEQPAALTRWWVRKEAVLKALHLGLEVEPSELEVTGPGQPPAVLRWPSGIPDRPLTVKDLDYEGTHVGAVAVRTDEALRLDAARLTAWS